MNNSIYIDRGTDLTIELTVIDDNVDTPDIPVNFSEFNTTSITLYVRYTVDDNDSKAIITKTGTITDEENGVVEFDFIPNDTITYKLRNNQKYPYEVIAVLNGKKYSVLKSTFTVVS